MLRYYGVLDWVYGQRPVNFQVRVGCYDYSVLPPQPPDMGQALNEMRNFAVTVPRGWQVLTPAMMASTELFGSSQRNVGVHRR